MIKKNRVKKYLFNYEEKNKKYVIDFKYDKQNNIIEESIDGNPVITYKYDSNNNLIEYSNNVIPMFRGKKVTYEYDKNRKLLSCKVNGRYIEKIKYDEKESSTIIYRKVFKTNIYIYYDLTKYNHKGNSLINLRPTNKCYIDLYESKTKKQVLSYDIIGSVFEMEIIDESIYSN